MASSYIQRRRLGWLALLCAVCFHAGLPPWRRWSGPAPPGPGTWFPGRNQRFPFAQPPAAPAVVTPPSPAALPRPCPSSTLSPLAHPPSPPFPPSPPTHPLIVSLPLSLASSAAAFSFRVFGSSAALYITSQIPQASLPPLLLQHCQPVHLPVVLPPPCQPSQRRRLPAAVGSWPARAAGGAASFAASWPAWAAGGLGPSRSPPGYPGQPGSGHSLPRDRAAGVGSPPPPGGGLSVSSAAAWLAWAARGRLPSAASWPAWAAMGLQADLGSWPARAAKGRLSSAASWPAWAARGAVSCHGRSLAVA